MAKQFVGHEEILGFEEILGREEILGNAALEEIVSSGAFVDGDELAMAREGGTAEKKALVRRLGRSTSCGYNSHWAHIRGEDKKPEGLIAKLAKKWSDYWNKEDVKARLKMGKELQVNNLSRKFFDTANEATQYKKPFKNPLTNKDMAYLYRATDGEGKWVFEWDSFYTGDTTIRLLKDIDRVLKEMREMGMTIMGVDAGPLVQKTHIRGDDTYPVAAYQAAKEKFIDPSFQSKQITKADIVKYLNTIKPENRAMAAKNLLDSFKYSGVTVLNGAFVGDEVEGRRQARAIIDASSNASPKQITKSDLKRAIDLWAGPDATKSEKLAVGAKMMSFLDKRNIKVA